MADFFDEMRDFTEETNSKFKQFWENEVKRGLKKPAVNLEENDKNFIAYFEMPGFEKDEIQVNITELRVELKGEKKKQENKNLIKRELYYSSVYRSINLPEKILPEKSKAKYCNGILEINMPKADTKKKNLTVD